MFIRVLLMICTVHHLSNRDLIKIGQAGYSPALHIKKTAGRY